MTPFDPIALLAMLLAFYPAVSSEALARARAERPDYFAGGTLTGSHGDKMVLPDGRGFDLIFDVENAGGNRHWQVIESGGPGGEAPSPWPLEPGPLTPIDGTRFPAPAPLSVFAPLVAAALDELGDPDTGLHLVVDAITRASSPADLESSYAATIAGADGIIVGQHSMLNGIDPSDIVRNHDALGGTIDVHDHDYDEPIPPDPPGVPDPGPAPGPDVPQPPDQP